MEEKRYEIKFIPEAVEDYKKLDGSMKKDVNKKVDKLSQNPLCGLPLGNKDNVDLTGFYKLYACGTSIRIVYRLLTPEKIEIVEIEATEKGVIPVLDAGIHLRKSLCCKEIDYRFKPDNDNFRSFSATL